MLDLFIETIQEFLANQVFQMVGRAIITLSQFVLLVAQFSFFCLPVVLLSLFLDTLFRKAGSAFYWKRFRDDFPATLEKCSAHPLFRGFAKVYILLFSSVLLVMGLLLFLTVIAPEEGMGVRESVTGQKIVMVLGCLSIFIHIIALVRISLYATFGIIKSWGSFTLSMMIW
jgi:hypothetical protein